MPAAVNIASISGEGLSATAKASCKPGRDLCQMAPHNRRFTNNSSERSKLDEK
jgi:hypothetical protein